MSRFSKCPKCGSIRVEYDGYTEIDGKRYLVNKCRKCRYEWRNSDSEPKTQSGE